MKKYYLTLNIIVFTILQCSCEKYLEKKSNDSLIVPSTIVDFQNLLDDGNTMNNSMPSLGISSVDDYFIDNAGYNAKSILFQNIYKWNPYPYNFQNDWSFCYKGIYYSNLCLERLQLLPRDEKNAKDWDQIKGSALFFKAYRHLELAILFAKSYDEATADTDLGIVIREGSDYVTKSERASVKQTYEKIIVDTKMAINLLPNQGFTATRPSKCAGYGLLARTYMAMRIYDSAAKYADLALQIQSSLMNYNDPNVVAKTAANPFKIFNAEVIFHTSLNAVVNLHHPSSGPAKMDTTLLALYKPNDLRKDAFFTAVSGYHRFKGSYSGNLNTMFTGIATDELLLTRAECLARKGERMAALDDLNLLLKNRFSPANFVPVNAPNANAALDSILIERRKELTYRGSLRFMDVKRLNKEGRGIVMKRFINNEIFSIPPNDSRYALQLPDDVVSLSGIKQN